MNLEHFPSPTYIVDVFQVFFLLSKLPLSSDFDAAGDVDTALNRRRWADDENKEERDWRVRGRSEREYRGGGAE